MGEMLTAAEAAKMLHISARKVYALAAAGELSSYRFGAAVRFDPDDLNAYKTKCRSPATLERMGNTPEGAGDNYGYLMNASALPMFRQ